MLHTLLMIVQLLSAFCIVALVLVQRGKGADAGAGFGAGTYTLILLFMVWVLPLFAAQPKLAPIYNPVDHMVPPPFPLLLILPAFAIDCIAQASVTNTDTNKTNNLFLILPLLNVI